MKHALKEVYLRTPIPGLMGAGSWRDTVPGQYNDVVADEETRLVTFRGTGGTLRVPFENITCMAYKPTPAGASRK